MFRLLWERGGARATRARVGLGLGLGLELGDT